MMWLRLVHIKRSNSEPTTQIEDQIIDLVNNTPFTLPEPLYLAVKSLGNVTTPTGAHLYLKSPSYPTEIIAGLGGFYGTLNEEAAPEEEEEAAAAQQAREARNAAIRLRHNLYEELPCPGVLAYAVQQSVSNANPGNYQSTVTLRANQPNANLLGFRALGYRRGEAKNLAFDANITAHNFQCYPQNTCFNLTFLLGFCYK